MPAQAPLHVRRHYGELPKKETEAVVGILGELIVTYLKKRRGPADRTSAGGTVRRSEGRR